MNIFCTLSDYNYLIYGLTLYRSLINVNNDFVLYYLCLDDKAYDKLIDLELENIIPIKIGEISSKKLEKLKEENYTNYCWATASYFTNWLMEYLNKPITYIDSDIYFFSDWQPFFDEIGEKSIGIVTHRFAGRPSKRVGFYNVGVVYFKNSEAGRNCLKWWSDVVLDNTNPYFKKYGTCGDQKYLELFKPLFKDVCVVDGIGHLASWNVQNHTRIKDERIIWRGKKQKLMYYHFSHFLPNFRRNNYKTNKKGEWYPEKTPGVIPLLDKYFIELKLTRNLYVL